jgi:hypothetical protein
VNFDPLVALPAGVTTVILPVVAPAGTVAVIFVDELTVKVAETPANLTAVAPVKLVPLIVTEVPTGPLFGEKDVIVGAPVAVTLKFVELVSVPPGVVTEIFPVVAPTGTVAVIFVEEFTVNVADVPLNLTAVAPVKLVPVIVTVAPTGPLVGEKDVMCGAAPVVTVKLVELVAVPRGVVTVIFPVVAPEGTVAVILVSELMVNAADVPPNLTDVAPVKPEPLIVTDVPTGPLVGENDVIVGAAEPPVTVNFPVLVAMPSGVTTLIRPVVAPAGTTAVIFVSESTVKAAVVPANFTCVAPVKPVPLIVTEVPTGPLVGENDEMVGTAAHAAGARLIVAIRTAATTTALPRRFLARVPGIARLLVGRAACARIMAQAPDRRYRLCRSP